MTRRWLLAVAIGSVGCGGIVTGETVDAGDDAWEFPDAYTAPPDTAFEDRWEPPPPDTTPLVDATPDVPPGSLPDRQLTVFLGSPDLPGRFICFGAFAPTSDPTTLDAPAVAFPNVGALGVPSALYPGDMTKTAAFQYGAVVPVPLTAEMIAALKVFKVAAYLLDENPAKTGTTCASAWKSVRADPTRRIILAPRTINGNQHGLVSVVGCVGASTDGTATCVTPGTNVLRFDLLDTAKPTSPADATIGLQFLHASQFAPPAGTTPGWNAVPGVDVYLATLNGTMSYVKLARAVSFGAMTSLVGARLLPSDSGDNAFLVVAPKDGPTCWNPGGAPTAGCANWTIPLKSFLDPATGYPRTGGGLFPETNQLIALTGSPLRTSAGTSSARIAFVRASTW